MNTYLKKEINDEKITSVYCQFIQILNEIKLTKKEREELLQPLEKLIKIANSLNEKITD